MLNWQAFSGSHGRSPRAVSVGARIIESGGTNMHKITLAILIPLTVAACAVSRVDPLSVPLVYKPNPKNVGLLGGLSCSAVSQVEAQDARSQKILGTRVHESKPLKADVTAGSDPAAWVTSGVQSVLKQNGFSTQGGGPKLVVTLDTLHTVESIWHRSSYDARIALSGELLSPAGKVCWKGDVEGQGGNYGYSGSIVNYQETLNAALDAATSNLFLAAGFKDALCHCSN
jgi:hypothetical protein